MAIDSVELRRVMGHFATGLTVVTTVSAHGEASGLTANAVASVSLNPPLVLVCVDKTAESHPHFAQSKVFTINILGEQQESVSRRFAGKGPDKFAGVGYRPGANQAPILEGAIAYMECTLVAAYEGGDHTIYVGEVQEASTQEGRPLLFFRGGYHQLDS
jgi:flavin reductase (DIM6/NTAB) family NADH-FMN oxidoreductase RutF